LRNKNFFVKGFLASYLAAEVMEEVHIFPEAMHFVSVLVKSGAVP
jgi:hypothetical protein